MFYGEIVTTRNGEEIVLQESRMRLVKDDEGAARHAEACALFAPFGWKPQASLSVRLHGKQVELLGVWKGRDYNYAAIKQQNAGRYEYDLINPEHLTNGA